MQFTSDFQEKDIVFGGDKKLAKIIDEIEVLFPLEQGHHRPVGMPDRPDRRRHRGGRRRRSEGIAARPSCRCAAKGSAACRSRSATTSPTTRSATGCSTRTREAREFESTPYDVSDHRRLQHRRRRLGLAASCSRRWACAWSRNGRATRTLAEVERDAEGQAQPHPLLPLDELHLAATWKRSTAFPGWSTTSSAPARSQESCARSPSTSTTRSRKAPSA